MSSFDAYEYVGVIVPGALPTLAAALLFPELSSFFHSEGFALGDFGIFLIISFVVGHVVQMVGGLIERVEDSLGMGKADRALKNKEKWFGEAQWMAFESFFADLVPGNPPSIDKSNYDQAVRTVYAVVRSDGRADRVDAFNRNFGMCRGLVAGSLLTIALLLATSGFQNIHYAILIFGFLSVPLFVRMRRFSRLFISELVAQAVSVKGH
jgi:hypothetical protein